jgi:hypothetical protein
MIYISDLRFLPDKLTISINGIEHELEYSQEECSCSYRDKNYNILISADNLQSAQLLMADFISRFFYIDTIKRHDLLDSLYKAVCNYYGVETLKSGRVPKFVYYKKVFIIMASDLNKYSLLDIALKTGLKNHATVIHHKKKFCEFVDALNRGVKMPHGQIKKHYELMTDISNIKKYLP